MNLCTIDKIIIIFEDPWEKHHARVQDVLNCREEIGVMLPFGKYDEIQRVMQR